MTVDILLLAAAAASTVLILFGVVILGDFQAQPCKTRSNAQPHAH
ncbi:MULTISPECIES: hypothetical protein [Rhodopseudomonas]|nr:MULTISPECIES: hypothetical protein [Rhodopseudomonas]MDF3812054.1 hypothetical protein [Rhodopseudomonas sp. BAL398]WOK16086.1 hypothetical protein RBJ75_18175 [Rhodopseudomonas sp. BAL398]